jgi:hypothetical protein
MEVLIVTVALAALGGIALLLHRSDRRSSPAGDGGDMAAHTTADAGGWSWGSTDSGNCDTGSGDSGGSDAGSCDGGGDGGGGGSD